MARLAMSSGIWNQVCFHSQQAVEKLIKGALPQESIPRTHKIVDLLKLLPVSLPDDLYDSLCLLDRFYIPVRYPDALPGSIEDRLPSREDAMEALLSAETLWNTLVDNS